MAAPMASYSAVKLALNPVKTCHLWNSVSARNVLPSFNQAIFHNEKRRFCAESSQPLTQVTQVDGIRKITLSNPKKRNALSLAMLSRVTEELTQDVDDGNLRAIIIASQGPVYSAGHDLRELTTRTGRAYHTEVFKKCSEMMMLIEDLPVPVIAQVKGLATAAGCQLVASCDIAVAAETARFATPGISVGLFCSTPAVAMGRAVPKKIAMQMLLTAEPITAEEALRHGLISNVVPEETVEEETMRIAQKICEYSGSVISLGKACFNTQMKMDRNSAYDHASDVMVNNLSLVEGQEGIDAFVNKRSPVWKHGFDKAHD
ncbi:enoyl-CoA hydratase domain-containing protein 3, mitochondrial-like [Lytechinus variegatus]|uniref:enoyl-CoA hydratase domain-containing protein 3, mitochondrial-like n=1 Tax=Lytechinus variegatus TaxID=7654 RepID=UPI001BB1EE68|nr:enoyl-CoA hydratase domain-containing protein 3, mitochondrial-like [Lytechinus variegatus]